MTQQVHTTSNSQNQQRGGDLSSLKLTPPIPTLAQQIENYRSTTDEVEKNESLKQLLATCGKLDESDLKPYRRQLEAVALDALKSGSIDNIPQIEEVTGLLKISRFGGFSAKEKKALGDFFVRTRDSEYLEPIKSEVLNRVVNFTNRVAQDAELMTYISDSTRTTNLSYAEQQFVLKRMSEIAAKTFGTDLPDVAINDLKNKRLKSEAQYRPAEAEIAMGKDSFSSPISLLGNFSHEFVHHYQGYLADKSKKGEKSDENGNSISEAALTAGKLFGALGLSGEGATLTYPMNRDLSELGEYYLTSPHEVVARVGDFGTYLAYGASKELIKSFNEKLDNPNLVSDKEINFVFSKK